MEVSEILAKAWSDVQQAALPERFHDAAFREAVRLRAGGISQGLVNGSTRPKTRSHAASVKKDQNGTAQPTPMVSEDEFFEQVAVETGADRKDLEELFHIDHGKPQFNYPARRLGDSAKARMVTVAQVIPVLRLYGLDESETSTRVIREEC